MSSEARRKLGFTGQSKESSESESSYEETPSEKGNVPKTYADQRKISVATPFKIMDRIRHDSLPGAYTKANMIKQGILGETPFMREQKLQVLINPKGKKRKSSYPVGD